MLEQGHPTGHTQGGTEKKREKEGVVEDKSKKQGVAGRSHYMLTQTSSIPLPQGSRVACGESKGSGDKEGVQICCTEIKSGQKMCFPKRFWGLFFGLGIVGFFLNCLNCLPFLVWVGFLGVFFWFFFSI